MIKEINNDLTLHVKRFTELTTNELYNILQVRSEVFVVEQNCVYQDLDNDDQTALHLWISNKSNDIVAVARVCAAGTHMKEVSIGRVATTVRACGYGRMVMEEAVTAALQMFNANIIEIEAQQYIKHMYEDIGFKQTSDVFLLDGIPHIKMTYCKE